MAYLIASLSMVQLITGMSGSLSAHLQNQTSLPYPSPVLAGAHVQYTESAARRTLRALSETP